MCLKKKISKADVNKFTVTNMKKKMQNLEASDVFSFSFVFASLKTKLASNA